MYYISSSNLKERVLELPVIPFPSLMPLYEKDDNSQSSQLLALYTTFPPQVPLRPPQLSQLQNREDACHTHLHMKENLGSLCTNRASVYVPKYLASPF